ncbi:MAG TPA: hypothetical protein VFI20_10755 [Terracidiphilus sp.]|nr:hypothetical protein [Terracidiphilus sp.]
MGDKIMLRRACLCALLVIFPAGSLGQALVPLKGEATLSTAYEYISFEGHFRSDGSRTPEAASKAQSVIFDLEYGVSDRLAITVSLPIVASRYASTNPPSDVLRVLFDETVQTLGAGFYNHQFLDDLQYHATLQDLRFSARYNVSSHPVVVTPFLGSVIPSHDYAFVGESAPGRNLKEFQLGTDVARRLDPLLRKAYVDGQFAYALPEASLDVRTTRANVSLEAGYLLKRSLAVRGFGQWQHTFNGLHFPADLTTPERALTHERLLKANYWHLGGGVSYAVSQNVEVSADMVTFLTGSDTHYGSGVVFRVSRSLMLLPNHRKNSQ